MDEFQATPPAEMTRLRRLSAELHADMMLREAVRLLYGRGGDEALRELRDGVSSRLVQVQDHEPEDDRPARLALEQLERAAQFAVWGSSDLRGWTNEARASIEEQR